MTGYNTWGTSWGTSWASSWGSGAIAPISSDNFLPIYTNGKRKPLGNIRFIYDKVKALPPEETIELQEAIEEFIDNPEPAIFLPDMEKINLAAMERNAVAYANFVNQLNLLRKKIALLEKQQADDDELLLFALLACTIN